LLSDGLPEEAMSAGPRYDPCPRCGSKVTGYDCVQDYYRSDPDPVLAALDPTPQVSVNAEFTMHPCECVIRTTAGPDRKMTGEMAGWQAHEGDGQ